MLHVVSAIERMGNAAVDIARIVTHRLGIPAALVADLAAAEEVSHRVRVRDDSALAHRSLADVELPDRGRHARRRDPPRQGVDHRSRRRRGRSLPDDVLILRGPPGGIAELRELAGAPEWRPPMRRRGPGDHRPRPRRRRARRDEEHLRGRDRPRLLGAALQRPEPRRRGEPPRGPARRDAGAARGVGAAQRGRAGRPVAAARAAAPRRARPRRSATRPSRWCGSSRRTRRCTRSWRIALGDSRRGDRAGAGRRRARALDGAHARRGAASSSRPASTSSRSAAPAATSTARAGTVRARRPATS